MASVMNKLAPYLSDNKKSAYKESILRNLSKKFNGGAINLDMHGVITAISEELLNLIGQPESLILDRNIADFIGMADFKDYFLNHVDSLIEGKVPNLSFYCLWESAPKKLNLLFELYPPEQGENEIGGFVQNFDATQPLLPHQDDIEQITQHLGALIWLWSADWKGLYYVSPLFKQYYEMTFEDYCKDPSLFFSRIHPDDLGEIMKQRDSSGEPSIIQSNFRYHLNNGSWRHINCYRFPLFDKDGKLVKFAGIALDTTPLYETQEKMHLQQQQLARVNQKLKKNNEMLEEFTMFACHDLAQPLRAFKIYTEILENTYLQNITQEGKLILLSIKAAMERMQDLITGIGRLASIGTIPIKPHPVRINVEEIIEKNIIPIYSPPLNPACTIEKGKLDPVKIKEEHMIVILENLITNSIKYTNKFPHIKIRSKKFKSAIVYAISDNGIGVPKEAEDYIFKLGKRLKAKPEQSGSGIGLSACKRIMSLYGGKIWVHSKLGEGTTFYLLFPESN